MLTMAHNPNTERLRQAGLERSRLSIAARVAEERYRAESEALRRANILEHGTEKELGDLRAEYVRQAQDGVQQMIRHRAEQGNFLAQLTVDTDFRITWTSGEAPADVVWERPVDGRF